MCTSVAIGFYIRDAQSYASFRPTILAMSRQDNSIFSVYEKKPTPVAEVGEGQVVRVKIDDEMEDDFCVV